MKYFNEALSRIAVELGRLEQEWNQIAAGTARLVLDHILNHRDMQDDPMVLEQASELKGQLDELENFNTPSFQNIREQELVEKTNELLRVAVAEISAGEFGMYEFETLRTKLNTLGTNYGTATL